MNTKPEPISFEQATSILYAGIEQAKPNPFEHATPRPWRLPENQDSRHKVTAILAPWTCDGSEPYHPLIVECLSRGDSAPLETARANAALIVHAVNYYDSLLSVYDAARQIVAEKCLQENVQGVNSKDAEQRLFSAVQAVMRLQSIRNQDI